VKDNENFIPISKLNLEDSIPLVESVLRSGNIAQGKLVQSLEDEFSIESGVENSIAVNNGTSALFLALKGHGIEPGQEVITSPFTFGATLNAIIAAGGKAKFADILEEDFNINPVSIESQITKETRFILPVHLYGQTANMDPIMELKDKHDLQLIEDAAQSAFATYSNKSAGAFGTGCFSFYATKNFTSSEGGMITTNNDELAARIRILRNQGMASRYEYVTTSLNYRMTDVQAAILIPQLSTKNFVHEKRELNAQKLNACLSISNNLVVPQQIFGRKHVWHQYTVLLKESSRRSRDEIVSELNKRNIGAGVYYPRLVFDYECFRTHPQVEITEVPMAQSISKRCFSLPVHQYLSDADLNRISEIVLEVAG
jgi:dTDP-4-amino-4,6-dideoxygalactose transaminase